ncbi:extracellular solute-binding protein [Paenibacillus sp. YN15]|uniref:extracellular solute-binding protein n=1 Tax=Paenibacillus sp. YN15 TaxID=1742774 RepID=UPI000DCF18E8|nr:extracellular solute-binding protein [Paenibacillus sp. YN15]RAU91922.1 hypothetical protein DQG13_28395 [Paenibacillus sp. YN15]
MGLKKGLLLGLSMMLGASGLLAACQTGGKEPAAQGASAAAGGKFDQPIKLKVYHAGAFNFTVQFPAREEDPIRQMLEKAVNVDLNVTLPSKDQIASKLNTMIASGDTPDMMFMWDKNVLVDYYNQGVLAELDDVLKDYPTLVNQFATDAWENTKVDGHIVAVPGYEPVNATRGWWIRNDWLRKLNLQAPTTSEELLEVMKAFTFNDPDGNGKDDTYGFVAGVSKDADLNAFGWGQIFLMFGVLPNTVDFQDGKVVFGNTDERMKEALAFIQKMIAAKVVDPDWVSINDTAAVDRKMYAGKTGIIINDWRRMEPASQEKMKEVSGEVPDWVTIPPVKGPHGDQWTAYKSLQNNGWAISQNAAKDPEKVKRILSLLEYWYTDKEAYPYTAYGIKGTQWEMAEGKPRKLELTKEQTEKLAWTANWAMPRRADDGVYFDFKNPKTSEFQQINLKYVKVNPASPLIVLDANDTKYNDRKKYINESLLKFMIGKESLTNWTLYLDTLNSKFDYSKYVENVNSQLKSKGLLK